MLGGLGGGPCDFSVSPSPNWTFRFGTALGSGLINNFHHLDVKKSLIKKFFLAH